MSFSAGPQNVVALAGGVGGAKLADGFAQVLPPESLTVIVNTGDDFEHLGLYISPDLDTVAYTLAGLANPETGWGRAGETWRALDALADLGGPDWFRLGDLDLATHLERTRKLRAGERLTTITADFCRAWGVGPAVLPMSDDPAPTIVMTAEGPLPFQEYFVRLKCEPPVRGFRFEGAPKRSPEVSAALEQADLVVICPSNPWVSIDPILAVEGVEERLRGKPVLAVSPLIGGRALKGPAAKMAAELGLEPSSEAVADHYAGLLTAIAIDDEDAVEREALEQRGLQVLVTRTWMRTGADRADLARKLLEVAVRWMPGVQTEAL